MLSLLRQLFHRASFHENFVPEPGRYYSIRYNEKYYKVLKILAVDSIGYEIYGVHICLYGRLFRWRPRWIQPGKLAMSFKGPASKTGNTISAMLDALNSDETTISHLPYTYDAWLGMFPRYICTGLVSEDELLGYDYWKEAKGGYWN